jgi:hypothetical protein
LARGERNATIGLLLKVSKALGVKIAALFDEDGRRQRVQALSENEGPV